MEEDPALDAVLAAARGDDDEAPGALLARARIASSLFGIEAPGLGRFRVLSRLGGGGMGVVYAAYDPQLDRGVALKTVHVPTASAEIALGEAKALARLSHPNIVPVFDVGIAEGHVYIVMEHVRGTTLRTWVETRALAEIVDVYRQAALALAAAHDAGLVHRDFKPDNAIVGTDGRVRVVDFGLACEVGAGKRAGTPGYMAPEPEVTPAADQFSFGVALREALAEPRPRWLEDVIARATAPAPADRFGSMHEVVRALGLDPARIRRRRWIATGVAIALLAVGASAFLVGRGAMVAAEACTGGERELDTAWSPSAQQAALVRIRALSPYGAELAPALGQQLADYRESWITNHRAACLAHRRGEQSDVLLDRRMACLERSRIGLATVAELATGARAEALPGLAQAVRAIPVPDACAAVTALLADVDPPAPAIAPVVGELRRDLQRARITLAAGQTDRAVPRAETTVASARTLGYRPLLAEALLVEGQARMPAPDARVAIERLREAQTIAFTTGLPSLGIEAWARREWLQGMRGDPVSDSDVVAALAMRGEPFPRALLHNNLAGVALAHDDRQAARRELEQAIAAARAVRGPGAIELVFARMNLGIVLDDPREREAAFDAAEAELVHLLGRDHPKTLIVAWNRATTLDRDPRTLAASLEQLCPRDELHPSLAARTAECWTELALARDELGARTSALAAIDRAVALGAEDWLNTAEAAGYAQLWRGDPAAARATFERHLRELPIVAKESWFRSFARAKLAIGLARATHGDVSRSSYQRGIDALETIARTHPAAIVTRRLARAHAELAALTTSR